MSYYNTVDKLHLLHVEGDESDTKKESDSSSQSAAVASKQHGSPDNIASINTPVDADPSSKSSNRNSKKVPLEEALVKEEGGWGVGDGTAVPIIQSRKLPNVAPVHDDSICNAKSRLLAGLEMCLASYEGDVSYLRLLLRFGCPVNAGDYDGRTAAHICCAENLLPAALVLLEFNADFVSDAVKDRWGNTPLAEAVNHNHLNLVDVLKPLLISKGVKVDVIAASLRQ